MLNKTILNLFMYCACFISGHSQTIRHPTKSANAGCYNCTSKLDWQDLTNRRQLQSAPFNTVLHLSFKRVGENSHYGTASFIAKDLLVTARHVVHDAERLEYIELSIPSFKNQWLRLNKKDYKIYYYTEQFNKAEYDVALIRIVDKQKLKRIYFGHFEIGDSASSRMSKNVNVTGYPFNKFAINSTAPDTLVNRAFPSDLLEFNKLRAMIGFPVCTCNGDSGGPVWIRSRDKYLIIGVCHGSKSKEEGFENPNLNIAVLINDSVAAWIATVKRASP